MFDLIIKLIGTVMGAVITYLFGGWDVLLQFLILVMVADYFTGMYKAYKLKDLSSKVGFTGIIKKVLILVVVVLAHGLDVVFTEEGIPLFGFEIPILRTIVIWAYIINEMVSILENLRGLNVYVPKVLQQLLDKLKSSKEEQANALVNINVRANHSNDKQQKNKLQSRDEENFKNE
ncbi:phage holin family protein [Shouchella patagoniensis]|uniref:phage holin family protein n=1 Tax=Shouchella patagoniensis TaxID=228576 RepID=UPI000995C1A0|nr:phage holin family protein [Shouchella patagoniensis]